VTLEGAKPSQPSKGEVGEDRIKVVVTPDRFSASVAIYISKDNQAPVTADMVRAALGTKGITTGIDDDAINNLVEDVRYNEMTVVARGTQPVPGEDGKLIFKFDPVPTFAPREDENGRIDYKDINFIQSAVAGQILVEKKPLTNGTPGVDVFGKEIPSRPGRDVRLPTGLNTTVSEDGLKLVASIDGSIVFASQRVNVNSVHTIGGDISIITGNIKHNGSLIIRGKIESGFEVHANGDIEVGNTVADAKVISGGNIMIKGGLLGSRSGLVQAAGDVHCKYVDDQVIVSGHAVTVGGELFNGIVTAKTRVVVTGSKGRIVGGRIMAGDEIRATFLGSENGTKTELQVAYEPNLMKRYHELIAEIKHFEENAQRVKESLFVFHRMKMDNKLSPERAEAMKRLEEFQVSYPEQRLAYDERKQDIEAEIQKNQSARIIAEQRVYPGVVLQFGIIYREIKDEMGPSCFMLSGGSVVWEDYRGPKTEPDKK